MSIDCTPKWAREARDHLLSLSERLDAAEAYIKGLETVRDELKTALSAMVVNYAQFGRVTDHFVQDCARLLQEIEG